MANRKERDRKSQRSGCSRVATYLKPENTPDKNVSCQGTSLNNEVSNVSSFSVASLNISVVATLYRTGML